MNPKCYFADRDATVEALDRMGVPKAPDMVQHMERTQPDDSPALTLVWRLSWLDAMLAHGRKRMVALPLDGGGTLDIDPAEVALIMQHDGEALSHLYLRGAGFCGTVALDREAVRALLWPSVDDAIGGGS